MNSKEIDGEVLRILIEILEEQRDSSSGIASDDAMHWLNIIGNTLIEVTGRKDE